MNVLVVGGSGFVGTRLIKRLIDKGVDVGNVDKSESCFFSDLTMIGDVRESSQISEAATGKSVIINLAAEHRDDVTPRSLYDEVNVQGAKNVCAAARANNVNKIVFTSSVAVYGFAQPETDEGGKIAPFNDYGRTKWEAEKIYRAWQDEDKKNRMLVIIRPTVIFGERNRGNVYNLFRQVAKNRFVMVGDGLNRKSMAYVENVAAFIEYSLTFAPKVHVFNYIDQPDFTMNNLVSLVRFQLGRSNKVRVRLPLCVGILIGRVFDVLAYITKRKFSISAIRVQKFSKDSVYKSAVPSTGFVPICSIEEAIEQTIKFEFLEDKPDKTVFYTE